MHVTQKLCTHYAKTMQKSRKIIKKLRKNYAYVCKLHNLHYYAPHFADGRAAMPAAVMPSPACGMNKARPSRCRDKCSSCYGLLRVS